MMKTIAIGICGSLILLGAAWVLAEDDLPETEASPAPSSTDQSLTDQSLTDQYSYAIGLDIGNSFRSSDTEINTENLLAGLRDGLSGAKPRFDQRTCHEALDKLRKAMTRKAMTRQQQVGAQNRELGATFLAENAQAEGVEVRKSGLQYKVIKSGDGASPGPRDTVRCNYKGTLIDGTVFDASEDGPIEFSVDGVIPGWTEALQLMNVGDSWRLFIPADLAYGDDPRGQVIQAGSALVFDIELLGIVGR